MQDTILSHRPQRKYLTRQLGRKFTAKHMDRIRNTDGFQTALVEKYDLRYA